MNRIKIDNDISRLSLVYDMNNWIDIYYSDMCESFLIWRNKYYINGRGVSAPSTVRFINRNHFYI